MHARGLALGGVLAVLVSASTHAQTDPIGELLDRGARYVESLEERLSVVIADETYVQEIWSATTRSGTRLTARRTIRSEALFMVLPGEDVWLFVRSVSSVDGRPVPDSRERLDRLLAAPGFDYISKLRALDAESARYDIGQVWRTTGYPTIALRFLLPSYQKRFEFAPAGEERVAGETVSRVRFLERDGPSVIQVDGRDVRSTGMLWLRPSDGVAVRTRVALTTPSQLRVSITVDFAHDARLDVSVPSRMDERYDEISGSSTRCSARYSNFRRFETSGRMLAPR